MLNARSLNLSQERGTSNRKIDRKMAVKTLKDWPVLTGSTAHRECLSKPLLKSQNREVLLGHR